MTMLDLVRRNSRVGLEEDRRIATVSSTHGANALPIGFEHADIVVSVNPEFPIDAADPQRGTITRFTVARKNANVAVDLLGVRNELSAVEKWIGDAECIMSPPRSSSRLTVDQVVAIVRRHLGAT